MHLLTNNTTQYSNAKPYPVDSDNKGFLNMVEIHMYYI